VGEAILAKEATRRQTSDTSIQPEKGLGLGQSSSPAGNPFEECPPGACAYICAFRKFVRDLRKPAELAGIKATVPMLGWDLPVPVWIGEKGLWFERSVAEKGRVQISSQKQIILALCCMAVA